MDGEDEGYRPLSTLRKNQFFGRKRSWMVLSYKFVFQILENPKQNFRSVSTSSVFSVLYLVLYRLLYLVLVWDTCMLMGIKWRHFKIVLPQSTALIIFLLPKLPDDSFQSYNNTKHDVNALGSCQFNLWQSKNDVAHFGFWFQ